MADLPPPDLPPSWALFCCRFLLQCEFFPFTLSPSTWLERGQLTVGSSPYNPNHCEALVDVIWHYITKVYWIDHNSSPSEYKDHWWLLSSSFLCGFHKKLPTRLERPPTPDGAHDMWCSDQWPEGSAEQGDPRQWFTLQCWPSVKCLNNYTKLLWTGLYIKAEH